MLYLQKRIYDASPKAISERTSYFRVRLEFLRYPQVIPSLCNVSGFGPPRRFNAASACPWIGHPVSGLTRTTIFRAINPRFHYDCITEWLSQLYKLTRWLILQKARRHPANAGLRPSVSIRFQILFHSPNRGSFHLSLTVLVHYRWFQVFSLGWWSTQIPTEFHGLRSTRE